ncbi:MAG: hypothetical protein IKY53_04060, partial [Lachnospiraceae bacterium]|nr:hypothetical protein [Lachnospiraceae bacterium]
MSKSMMRKGILLVVAVSMIFMATACSKNKQPLEDYRDFVYKESSSFEISEDEYGYLSKVAP